jgi:hypothetical protein
MTSKSKDVMICGVVVLLCMMLVGGYVIKVWASPASGVTRILVGRGTYDRFMVNTDEKQGRGTDGRFMEDTDEKQAPFHYMAKAHPAIDMEVDTHIYAPVASTGWHKHPGPVYITVTSGELTFYEYDDPTCSPHVYKAGEGFVDFGNGHIGINHDPNKSASDVTVAITYVGGPFRSELPGPGPYCSF